MAIKNTIAYLTARGAQLPDGAEYRLQVLPVPANGDRPVVSFSGVVNEYCLFTVPQWPSVYQGSGTLKVTFQCIMATANAGDIDLDVEVEAVTAADALDLDATNSFDSSNSSNDNAVPGTAGYLFGITVTLTNKDSVAVGDYVRLRVTRDAQSDLANGDLRILGGAIFEEITSMVLDGDVEVQTLFIGATSAPSDGELSNGQVSLWFDPANGASKLMVKGKSTDGTVVTGEVALT